MTEIDTLLEITEKEAECEGNQQANATENRKKAEQSRADASDMRLMAMETLREGKKRKTDDNGSEKQKRQGSRGSDAVEYLREKMEEKKWREQELELKRKNQEKDAQQQREFMTMMQTQQQQMQQMMQAQQQQNQLLMALLEKVVRK